MNYTCIQRGDGFAISLDHIKSHLRIEHSHEDNFLAKLIRAATESVENYLKRTLLLKTWQCTHQALTHKNTCEILLAYPPFFSICSVNEVRDDGTKKAIKRYILSPHTHTPKLSVYGRQVEVIYKAGFGDNYMAIPEAIRQGITLLVGEMFEKRVECEILETPSVRFLLNPYRVMPCL